MSIRLISPVLAMLVLLTACGGGGGSGANTNPPPAAPQITYGQVGAPSAQFSLVTHDAVSLVPTNKGGAVATWTITPALPAGLSFNTSSGAITGAPTSAFAPINITVTATNAGGSGQFPLVLRADSVLLNMGTRCLTDTSGGFQQGALAISVTHVLAIDCGMGEQHWVLWDYSTGALVAQGNACPIDTCAGRYVGGLAPNMALAGQIAVVPYTQPVTPGPTGFRVISVTDGRVLATITPLASIGNWRVASDGSYICGAPADGSNLTVWAPDGSVITTVAGNYMGAALYCAPGEVRVAMGPKGTNVIETITLPGGASSVSPAFAGTFKSWFSDGSAFLSNVDKTVWVYSPTAVQQDFRTLPTALGLAGWGPWFWTVDDTTLSIYKVGASSTPAATYAVGSNTLVKQVTASGSTIAFTSQGSPLHVVDLSGAIPSETDYSPPFSDVYAAVSASQWIVGAGGDGAVLDGASLSSSLRYFGHGAVRSLAGSQSRIAVATSIGEVLIYKTDDLSLETKLNISAEQLALSADGSVLAIRTRSDTDATVKTLALPSNTVLGTWSYQINGTDPYPSDITLSSSGALLGQVLTTGRQVTASNGGPVLWSDHAGSSPIRLSLDDTLIAVSDGTNSAIYLNDQPSTVIPGEAVGWLQNNNLYADASKDANAGVIFNSAGIKQTAPTLPTLNGPIQVLSATSIFDSQRAAIYSLTTGEVTWPTPAEGSGPSAAAGSVIAFRTFSNQIVVEPY